MKTINTVFLILLVSLAVSPVFTQSDLSIGSAEINTFVQKVEGAGNLTATVQAADGGYVTTSRIDDTSFLVRKIKASGTKQWERRLNWQVQHARSIIRINGIVQTTDGEFVLAGQEGTYALCFDFDCAGSGVTVVKLRPNGTVAWQKSFDVSGHSYSRFSSLIATPDGGFIAIGAVADNGYTPLIESLVVGFAATGDVVWGKKFNKRIATVPGKLPLVTSTATPDNGFIVAFPTSANVSIGDLYPRLNAVDVMKITNSGNVVWEKSLKTGSAFVFQSTGKTAEGGVILVGTRKNSNKLRVVVLNADGTLNWKAGYHFQVPGTFKSVSSPIQTPDGGYVITGSTYDASVKKYYGLIAKIDSSGEVAFQNTFDGHVSGSVFATADGGSFLLGSSAGSTSSDLLVSKVNSERNVPGCDYFQSLGTTKRTSFGRLRIKDVNITEPADVLLKPIDFGLTSVVSNSPVSTVCN